MKTFEIKNAITSGHYDDVLLKVYCDSSLLDYQRKRYTDLISEFEEHFGPQDIVILSVPGRSEITGNHTDHQLGSILACSVNLDIIAAVAVSDDLVIYSNGSKIRNLDIDNMEYSVSEEGTSTALVKGVFNRLSELGYKTGGFKAAMTSDVLVGSGISSSAAFEDMIGNIISHLFNGGTIDKVEISKASQYSENKYFGKPCGLMDQCACAIGGIIYIDFKDKNNPFVKKVDVDFNQFGYSLCIVNTGGSHSNLTNEYASIPEEMKKVAEFFGKSVLREVDERDIIDNVPALREKLGDRCVLRALHMLEEQKRVLKQLENFEHNDFKGFLNTIQESGNSSFRFLQNVYPSSNPSDQPISTGIMLSEIILGDNGVVRVHGGGFAGTIQAFVKNDFVQTYQQEIEKVFGRGSCMVLQVNNLGACKVIG